MEIDMQGQLDEIVNEPVDFDEKHPKAYVCGFLLSHDRKRVALICKLNPEWQRNRLNGIGGKIEAGETPLAAMRREFKEEAGLEISGWRCFALLSHLDVPVFMFVAQAPKGAQVHCMEAEVVEWYDVSISQSSIVISNLSWLIPMALSGNLEAAMVCDNSALPTPLGV